MKYWFKAYNNGDQELGPENLHFAMQLWKLKDGTLERAVQGRERWNPRASNRNK